MSEKNDRPDIVKIAILFPLTATMTDFRSNFYGIVFGTIGNVAKQYGIDVSVINGMTVCSAPKGRMQLFVEKLHFSRIPYREV